MNYDVKAMVKDKQVTFVRYRKGELIYVTECGFEFPVPVADAGDGIFLAKDKALMYMRYIRKHIESIETERAKMLAE